MIFLPWSLIVVPAVYSAVKAWRRSDDRAARLSLAWFGAVFIFFTLMSGKRSGYLMPLMPAFGLLMGRYLALSDAKSRPWPRAHRVLVSITLALIALGLVAGVVAVAVAGQLTHMIYPLDVVLEREVLAARTGLHVWIVASAVVGVLLAFIGWREIVRRGRSGLLAPTMVGLLLVVSLLVDAALLPRANLFKSGKNFVRAAKGYLENADAVFLYRKDYDGVYNLYTGRVSIPVLPRARDLKVALLRPQRVAVIIRDKDWMNALDTPLRIGHVAAIARVGHRRMFLVTNWADAEAKRDM